MPAPDGEPPDGIDPGEPIEALTQLREPVSPGLLRRVRQGIQRRMLAAQLVELSFVGAVVAILEYLKVMLQAINRGGDGRPGGSR